MILNDGICTVFKRVNTAQAGQKPVYGRVKVYQSWYARLDFVTVPRWAAESREDVNISQKIRVLQNRSIDNHHVVVLAPVDQIPEGADVYEVIRVYHGTEDDTGRWISDISLEAIK